jgi:hypothetical protein
MDIETVSKALKELAAIGFVKIGNSEWILMPKFLKFNAPENQNVGKMVEKLFAQIPESSGLISDASDAICNNSKNLPNCLLTICKGYAKPFQSGYETVSKPYPKGMLYGLDTVRQNNESEENKGLETVSKVFSERFAKGMANRIDTPEPEPTTTSSKIIKDLDLKKENKEFEKQQEKQQLTQSTRIAQELTEHDFLYKIKSLRENAQALILRRGDDMGFNQEADKMESLGFTAWRSQYVHE